MASDTEAPDETPRLSSMGRFKITAEQREITALRATIATLEAELAVYREADEARQRQGELEWIYTQRRMREEAEKREAGRWSSQ